VVQDQARQVLGDLRLTRGEQSLRERDVLDAEGGGMLRLFSATLDLQDEEADGLLEVRLALDRVVAVLVNQQTRLQMRLPLEKEEEGDARRQEGHEKHHKRDTL
jgi:hypothetical protein